MKKVARKYPTKALYVNPGLVVVPENISLYKFTLTICSIRTVFYQIEIQNCYGGQTEMIKTLEEDLPDPNYEFENC